MDGLGKTEAGDVGKFRETDTEFAWLDTRPQSVGTARIDKAANPDRPVASHVGEFEKRAAIMEFDGGLSRRDADREAALAVIRRYGLH